MASPLLLAHLFLSPILIIILVQTHLPIDATEATRSTAIFSTTAMTTMNIVWSIINKSLSAIVLSSIRQSTGEADK
jgi:hypothetical protein